MNLNELMAKLADNKPLPTLETKIENTTIPTLDQWELNLTLAALKQYINKTLKNTDDDTPKQRKRKIFNRMKASSAINKIRTANKRTEDGDI